MTIASEEEAESEETDPTEETESVETDSTEGVSEETSEDFGDSQAGIDEAYESWEDAEDSGENSGIRTGCYCFKSNKTKLYLRFHAKYS